MRKKHSENCNEAFSGMSKGESRVCLCAECETNHPQTHTPTPWYLPNGEDKNKFSTYRIAEEPGKSAAHLTNIALAGSLEDAAFIVRAVNSHEASLSTLRNVLVYLKGTSQNGNLGLIAEVEGAIAQAEGKV